MTERCKVSSGKIVYRFRSYYTLPDNKDDVSRLNRFRNIGLLTSRRLQTKLRKLDEETQIYIRNMRCFYWSWLIAHHGNNPPTDELYGEEVR